MKTQPVYFLAQATARKDRAIEHIHKTLSNHKPTLPERYRLDQMLKDDKFDKNRK